MSVTAVMGLIGLAKEAVNAWGDHDERKQEGKDLIAKLEDAKDDREIEFLTAKLSALMASDKNQTEINKIEASSKSFFKSGWRPFIGWVSGFGFLYVVMIQPFLEWMSLNLDWTAPPMIPGELLFPVMLGMLGLATQRTYEKQKGLTL